MVMKAKWKDSLRGIRKSRNRFLSILCIVMIGVGFFAGVKASGPDMWRSADSYADQQNLMHYRLLSTWGFEEADIEALRELEGVEVFPSYFLDSLVNSEQGENVARIYAYDSNAEINQVWLTEGRMPESPDECLVDAASGVSVGSTLEVMGDGSSSDSNVEDSLERTEYTVVGAFESSMYLSDMEKGNTNIGGGTIEQIIYLPVENFKSEYYTEVYLVYEDMITPTAYTEEYAVLEATHQQELEIFGEARAKDRYDRTVEEAEQEIADGEAELEDGRQELADARQQLEDAKQQAADGEAEIVDGEAELDEGEAEIEQNEADLQNGEAELDSQQAILDETRATLEAAQQSYEEGRSQWEAGKAQAEQELAAAKQKLDDAKAELDQALLELQSGEAQYEQALAAFQSQMEQAQAKLDAQSEQLAAGREQYEAGEVAYQQGLAAYQEALAQYEQSLASYEQSLVSYQGQEAQYREQENTYQQDLTQYQSENERYEALASEIESLQTEYDQALASYKEEAAQLEAERIELEALLAQVGEDDPAYLAAKAAYDAHEKQVQDAYTALTTQENELENKKKESETLRLWLEGEETALAETRTQLNQIKSDLETRKAELEQWNSALAQTQETLAQTEASLTANRETLDQTLSELEAGEALLEQAQAQLDMQRQEGENRLAAFAEQLASGREEYETGEAQYESGLAQYEQQKEAAEAELDAAEAELDAAWNQIVVGQDQLRTGEAQIAEARAQLESARAQIQEARAQIVEGRQELAEARIELEEGRLEIAENEQKVADAEAELAQGEQELADAKQELEDLTEPEWYVNTRDDSPGYEEYGQNAERVDNIAKVFPVFFVLVAALVCLTTMTRMIEEERTQIGTMKALGYSNGSILSKYMFYALLATGIGVAVGLVVGYQLFPGVIMSAYGMLYRLPVQITPFLWGDAAIIMAVCLAAVALTVYLCCRGVLTPMPAQLMRPKAPKNGKRVMLERIGWLWKRLSFSHKVTVRNIFRYKKRMIMTIVGIMGCTALSLTGFGLQDSINEIVENQFDKIWKYEATIVVEDYEEEDLTQILSIMQDYDASASEMLSMQKTYTMSGPDGDMSGYLMVPESTEKLSEFIQLENRTSHEVFVLEENQVLVTEKLARNVGVSPGDMITIEIDDTNSVQVMVQGIVENYAEHYVYMLPETYQALFGEAPEYNMVLGKYEGLSEESQHEMAERINQNDHVMTIQMQQDIMESFKQMLAALDMVIVVLIVSAGLLAFVVLYNLSNINIAERVREIATLEVLGFNDKEVSQYVFRESIILTVLGTAFGLVLGRLLTAFVIQTAEIDMVMFGREVQIWSYLWAALLTLVFSFIVNLVMHWPLKKISMVESLKSVE